MGRPRLVKARQRIAGTSNGHPRPGGRSGAAVSTRSATGARARLGRAGRGRQVLLEDLTRRAIAEAAPRGVVEPVGEPAEGGAGERLGRALARQEAPDTAVQALAGGRGPLPGGAA